MKCPCLSQLLVAPHTIFGSVCYRLHVMYPVYITAKLADAALSTHVRQSAPPGPIRGGDMMQDTDRSQSSDSHAHDVCMMRDYLQPEPTLRDTIQKRLTIEICPPAFLRPVGCS